MPAEIVRLPDRNDLLRLRRLRKWVAIIDYRVQDLFDDAVATSADWQELRGLLSDNLSDLDYEREIRAFLNDLDSEE